MDTANAHVPTTTITKIVPEKLKVFLESNPFTMNSDSQDVDALATGLSDTIAKICGSSRMSCAGKPRRSVYWWSPELSALHRDANHLRRVHKRKRKKVGPDACSTEAETAKTAKTQLCKAIKRAKEKAWIELCDQVERDPWGKPYKLVMGKLCRNSKIPGINTPGRMQQIVQGLFPTHEERVMTEWPRYLPEEAYITVSELKYAANQLKNSVAPGPDRVPNEAIKVICRSHPEVYNKLRLKLIIHSFQGGLNPQNPSLRPTLF